MRFTGRTAIDRLIYMIPICPSVAPQAYELALQLIHQSRDPIQLTTLHTAYEQAFHADNTLPSAGDLPQLDPKWAEDVISRNQAERSKLEVELKTYSSNMIKESIRVCFISIHLPFLIIRIVDDSI